MPFFDWMTGSRAKRVAAQLRSPDARTRRAAIEGLNEYFPRKKNRDIRDAMIAALKDTNGDVRAAAVAFFLPPGRQQQLSVVHKLRAAARSGDQHEVAIMGHLLSLFPFSEVAFEQRDVGLDSLGRLIRTLTRAELIEAVERLLQDAGLVEICEALVEVARQDSEPQIASEATAILRGAGLADLLPKPVSDSRTSTTAPVLQELLDLCTRRDILDPGSLAKSAAARLADAGVSGSDALAGLIEQLFESRNVGLVWALIAAKDVVGTPRLRGSIERIRSSTPVRSGGEGRFAAEITGNNEVGFTDGTWDRVQRICAEALRRLGS